MYFLSFISTGTLSACRLVNTAAFVSVNTYYHRNFTDFYQKIPDPSLHSRRLLSHATLRASSSATKILNFPETKFPKINNRTISSDMTSPAEDRFLKGSISDKGEFKRQASAFRNWITADGPFKPEKGRYHLYVSLACPWAHRTVIVRKLKGLEDVLGYTVVDWYMGEKGWSFTDQKPKTSLDTVNNCKYLREVYLKADPEYTGRITVPVLWDKQTNTVVNNESSEIIRILNREFNEFSATAEQRGLDLYPDDLKSKIDEVNAWVYDSINNGVYKCGFAKSQEAYDDAAVKLFASLDRAEDVLSKSRYLCGDRMTEADVRLFTTLVRFDTVYVHLFKCNKKRIVDYPNLWGFLRDIYQTPGVKETVDQEHIQKHYQESLRNINPTGIVAIGPELDFDAAHGRDTFFKK